MKNFFLLAQVYSGHPIHGLHIALRASALVGTVETDLGVALIVGERRGQSWRRRLDRVAR